MKTWFVYPATYIAGSNIQHPAHDNLALSDDLLSFQFTCQVASISLSSSSELHLNRGKMTTHKLINQLIQQKRNSVLQGEISISLSPWKTSLKR